MTMAQISAVHNCFFIGIGVGIGVVYGHIDPDRHWTGVELKGPLKGHLLIVAPSQAAGNPPRL